MASGSPTGEKRLHHDSGDHPQSQLQDAAQYQGVKWDIVAVSSLRTTSSFFLNDPLTAE